MSKNNEIEEKNENEIIQIPIRMRRKEKDEMIEFAKKHKKTFAEFSRACMNFFKIRDTTPDKFISTEGASKSVDLSPISEELSEVKLQLAEMHNAFKITRGISREAILLHIDRCYMEMLEKSLNESDDFSEVLKIFSEKMAYEIGRKLLKGELEAYTHNLALDKLSEIYTIKNGKIARS